MRRLSFCVVVMVTASSVLLNQTYATMTFERWIHEPARANLSAGPLTYASAALQAGLRSTAEFFHRLYLATCGTESTSTFLSPAGRPHSWQAGVPVAPFSSLNTGTGNVFTEVPVVSWQGLGRPTAFSLFHNTLGDDAQNVLLPEGWTHSYSRRVSYDDQNDEWTLITDEGEKIVFSDLSEAPDFVPATSASLPIYSAPPGYFMWLAVEPPYTDEIVLYYKSLDKDVFDFDDGRLLRLEDAAGNTTTLTYDEVLGCAEEDEYGPGRILQAIQDASGNVLELELSNPSLCSANCEEVVDGSGVSIGCGGFIVHVPDIGDPTVFNMQKKAKERYFTVLTDDSLVSVSTARLDDSSPPAPAFWTHFYTDGRELELIVDRLGTEHVLVYDGNGMLASEISADGEVDDAPTTEFEYDLHPYLGSAGSISVIAETTQTGPRDGAVTHYCSDSSGRLITVTDPLGREVMQASYGRLFLPTSVTNVLGGVTEYSYDDWGNALSVSPPTGGDWTFTYNTNNCVISIVDPESYETELEYLDSTNPTRPTKVDGPGSSDLALAWGSDSDSDLGKLVKSFSPNGIEQGFIYGSPDTWDEANNNFSAGIGQLHVATFGRGDTNGTTTGINVPLQDLVRNADSTGNVWATAASAHFPEPSPSTLHNPCESEPFIQEDDVSGGGGGNLTSEVNPLCANEVCSVTPDQDQNPEENCSARCDSEVPAEFPGPSEPTEKFMDFDGYGQPISMVQGLQSHNGSYIRYQWEHDALGRRTRMDTTGVPGTDSLITYLDHFNIDPTHTLEWEYDLIQGTMTRTYSLPLTDASVSRDPQGVTPIVHHYVTDLAGRVSEIYENSALVASYEYNDSTTLPAVVETKYFTTGSLDVVTTEYYFDVSGQIAKVVHAGGDEFAFEYQRDTKQRITVSTEYVGGIETAETTFTYGSGNLSSGDLDADSSAAVDPDKLYYSWFSSLQSLSGSDPNRLVREVRTGANAYHHQYWYDAGGNRLVMVKSEDIGTETPNYQPVEMIRYNYAFAPNVDILGRFANGYFPSRNPYQVEPRLKIDEDLGLGEPLAYGGTGATGAYFESHNSYLPPTSGEGHQGQDKLLSYTTYHLNPSTGEFVDDYARYTFYDYHIRSGKMNLRYSWDGEMQHSKFTEFTYEKHRVESVRQVESDWTGLDEYSVPNDLCGSSGFLEVYTYNLFGERIAMFHSSDYGTWQDTTEWMQGTFPDNLSTIKHVNRNFDYVDGMLFAERKGNLLLSGYRFLSYYRPGALGPIARVGLTTAADASEACEYMLLGDSMGNVQGVYDSVNRDLLAQTYDAFGNLIGDHMAYQCETFSQTDELMPNGMLAWRGGEGTQTDWVTEEHFIADRYENQCKGYPIIGEDYGPYERESTGLVYMQARYYEPETGRFTQRDEMAYQISDFKTGQNNRWVYCGNDPVNLSDPNGMFWGAVGTAVVGLISMYAGYQGMIGNSVANGLLTVAGGIITVASAVPWSGVAAFLGLTVGALALIFALVAFAILAFVALYLYADYRAKCRAHQWNAQTSGMEAYGMGVARQWT